jgi:putative hydrolase of the HAD superfamily
MTDTPFTGSSQVAETRRTSIPVRYGSMTKAIIFDLDNCLAPADEVGRELLEPMFAAIRGANNGRVSDEQIAAAFDDCWRLPLDAVARKYQFSDEMLMAGWEIGRQLTVSTGMKGYADLRMLKELPARNFVVTSGFRKLQASKIEALGLQRLATAYIDAIDDSMRKGKQQIFEEIIARHHFQLNAVLVVGDNPESEIEAGNRLGTPTVQILRPGVVRGTNATHYIQELAELRALLEE